jgi:hypothetical protein
MLGLRAGKTLRDLWVKAPQLQAYFSSHAEYAREARPLLESNVEAARRRMGARLSSRTHCLNGHLFAENGRDTIFQRLIFESGRWATPPAYLNRAK